MKNIYVIPTEKASRLTIRNKNNELMYSYKEFNNQQSGGITLNTNQHIYITSDEEIKEGDWFLRNSIGAVPTKATRLYLDIVKKGTINDSKKIILTTDQDLINDDVQAIDDEFLEWFVKNPSCEEVKWNAYPIGPNGNIIGTDKPYPFDGLNCNFKIQYKIIIPTEEPIKKPKAMPIFDLNEQNERNEYAMSDAEKKRMNEFVDEFLDCLYLSGSKEDGKYILTLSEATEAAKDLFLKKVL